jgi:GDP-D-mannose dehydratase
MKKALITRIPGQNYPCLTALSTHYRRKDYPSHDSHDSEARRSLRYGDSLDNVGLQGIMRKVSPEEVYNFSAQVGLLSAPLNG